jgi:hypothetical protein
LGLASATTGRCRGGGTRGRRQDDVSPRAAVCQTLIFARSPSGMFIA